MNNPQFKDAKRGLNNFPTPELLTPTFGVAASEVSVKLAALGACMIIAPPHSGKSALLSETETMIKNLWEEPTLSIDAAKIGMTSQGIDEANVKINEFDGAEGVVFIDHFDTLLEKGKNTALNFSRGSLLTTILELARNRNRKAAICLASQGRQTSSLNLMRHFSLARRYYFDGNISRRVASQILSPHQGMQEVEENIDQLSANNDLTYGSVTRLLEGAVSAQPDVSIATPALPPARPQREVDPGMRMMRDTVLWKGLAAAVLDSAKTV